MRPLFEAYWKITDRMESKMKDLGLNYGNPKVFLYLARKEGCKQADIARDCYIRSATLTTVLSNMEGRGLIKRERVPEDRRSYRIYLTEEGNRISQEIYRRIDITASEAYSGFSEKEIEELRSYLNRISRNLEKNKDMNQ